MKLIKHKNIVKYIWANIFIRFLFWLKYIIIIYKSNENISLIINRIDKKRSWTQKHNIKHKSTYFYYNVAKCNCFHRQTCSILQMFKYDYTTWKNTGRLLDDDDYYVMCRSFFFHIKLHIFFICIWIYIYLIWNYFVVLELA